MTKLSTHHRTYCPQKRGQCIENSLNQYWRTHTSVFLMSMPEYGKSDVVQAWDWYQVAICRMLPTTQWWKTMVSRRYHTKSAQYPSVCEVHGRHPHHCNWNGREKTHMYTHSNKERKVCCRMRISPQYISQNAGSTHIFWWDTSPYWPDGLSCYWKRNQPSTSRCYQLRTIQCMSTYHGHRVWRNENMHWVVPTK